MKYIATRKGSVAMPDKNDNAPATQKQQELISFLVEKYPDTKYIDEFKQYADKPTLSRM